MRRLMRLPGIEDAAKLAILGWNAGDQRRPPSLAQFVAILEAAHER